MSSQKIRIRLKGYDHEVVDQSAKLIVDTAQKTGARVSGPIPLPTERNLYTVIRSPHKDKDSREQFEMRTHKRLIDILDPSPSTVPARRHRDQALSGLSVNGRPDLQTGRGLCCLTAPRFSRQAFSLPALACVLKN